jgi:hypothetical protein
MTKVRIILVNHCDRAAPKVLDRLRREVHQDISELFYSVSWGLLMVLRSILAFPVPTVLVTVEHSRHLACPDLVQVRQYVHVSVPK